MNDRREVDWLVRERQRECWFWCWRKVEWVGKEGGKGGQGSLKEKNKGGRLIEGRWEHLRACLKDIRKEAR